MKRIAIKKWPKLKSPEWAREKWILVQAFLDIFITWQDSKDAEKLRFFLEFWIFPWILFFFYINISQSLIVGWVQHQKEHLCRRLYWTLLYWNFSKDKPKKATNANLYPLKIRQFSKNMWFYGITVLKALSRLKLSSYYWLTYL